MSTLVRFGISMERELLKKFDRHIKEREYSNRSEAIRDLIRESLIKREWKEGKEVVGVIGLVYNHHIRELTEKLTEIQHHYRKLIISSQHIHLDEDNCFEMVVVRGRPNRAEGLAELMKAIRGVKYGSLMMATTGKELL